MPVKPENRARYPKDWPEISKRIRFERARGQCECEGECLIGHCGRCSRFNGELFDGTKIVLTVAHLDHDPANCIDDNLRAMCQRCHLAYDHKHHQRNAAATRRSRKASGDLFP